MKRFRIISLAVLALTASASSPLFVPMAAASQGGEPPPPRGAPPAVLESEGHAEYLIFYRHALEAAGDSVLQSINEKTDFAASWAEGARPLKCGYDCVSPPSMSATVHLDWPNQYFARISAHLKFEVSRFEVAHRTIHVPVEVHFYCQNWESGNGQIQIYVVPGRPWADGGSLLEAALDFILMPLNISRRIDTELRRRLETLSLPGETLTPRDSACRSLGVLSFFAEDHPQFDAILWDRPEPTRPMFARRMFQPATVTFMSVKRLQTPAWASEQVEEDEPVGFFAYVNGQQLEFPVTIPVGELDLNTNETATLEEAAISFARPGAGKTFETLQVIIVSSTGSVAWAEFGSNENFGAGLHILTTRRWGLVDELPLGDSFRGIDPMPRRPDRGKRSAEWLSFPDYEITYRIRFRQMRALPR